MQSTITGPPRGERTLGSLRADQDHDQEQPPLMLATITPWNLPIGMFEVPARGGTLFGKRW